MLYLLKRVVNIVYHLEDQNLFQQVRVWMDGQNNSTVPPDNNNANTVQINRFKVEFGSVSHYSESGTVQHKLNHMMSPSIHMIVMKIIIMEYLIQVC